MLVMLAACGGDVIDAEAATSTGDADASAVEPSDGGADRGDRRDRLRSSIDAPEPAPGEHPQPPEADAGQGCEAPLVACDERCVNLLDDPDHCGTCGHTCPGGLGCDGNGWCVPPPGCIAMRRLGHDYFVCEEGRSWHAARDACLALGMDLIVLDDSPESAYVVERLERWAAGKPIWLGLNDLERGGAWKWISLGSDRSVSGVTPTFVNWAGGEPNGDDSPCKRDFFHPFCRPKPDEDCGAMAPDGAWFDLTCSTSIAYACETTSAPLL